MRYLGSKDKLMPAIQSLLCEKGLTGRDLLFFDAFCGTGAVANGVKDLFRVVINDSMRWSVLYAKGCIVGSKCTFTKLGFNPFKYFNENKDAEKGFFYTNYSSGGSDRMYFTAQNAGRIDFIRKKIEEWRQAGLIDENEFAYLIYCLIEAVSSVSNTAGVYGASLKHWDPRSSNILKLEPLPMNMFDGDCDVETHCDKIEDVISEIDCDVLYLDPPYTQNQYGTQYHLLETLVLNDHPSISKITGSRPVTPLKSLWSKEIHANMLLDYVVANTKAKHIILSYNNDGFMSKDFIESVFKRYGIAETYTCHEIDYKKYNNFKCREREGHLEYLFYVEKKPSTDVVYESPLNYSGSKAKMINFIKCHLPKEIDTFIDAFGGGFNVGINAPARHIIYNDINQFVVGLIKSFKDVVCADYIKNVNKYIKTYELAPNNKEKYNELRDLHNKTSVTNRSPILLYALILFGFQQQIRFNSDYGFNNPCGSRRFNDKLKSKFISFARIIKQQSVEMLNEPFENLEKLINSSNFFYFDPPYRETTASYNDGKRGFEGWSISHERRLCSFMDRIDRAQGKFMFSCVIELGSFHNYEVENWARANGYSIIDVAATQGRYNNRKEVLIINY